MEGMISCEQLDFVHDIPAREFRVLILVRIVVLSVFLNKTLHSYSAPLYRGMTSEMLMRLHRVLGNTCYGLTFHSRQHQPS